MKLIQLNIFKGQLFTNTLDFFREEKPDIITLQEVAVSKGFDAVAKLKQELGMRAAFAPIYGVKKPEGIIQIGNAILTKFKMGQAKTVFYDSPYKTYGHHLGVENPEAIEQVLSEPKNFLSATLETPSGKLRVVTTHLVWSEYCSESLRRIGQARKLAKATEGKLPTVVAGDFNIHPNSPSLKVLSKGLTNLGPGITNTLNPRRHRVFKSIPEGLAVDYILGKGVSGSARALNVDVSDHLPLVAEIHMAK